jgi:hypothetical protein
MKWLICFRQLWGFTDVKGSRMFTRNVVVRRTDKEQFVHAKLFFDWVGELE